MYIVSRVIERNSAARTSKHSMGCLVRSGQTLMELIVASGIILIALVPALRLTREGMKISRDIETSSLLATLCASKLEEHLALSAAVWAPATVVGNFAPMYPRLLFQVVRTDSPIGGGIPNALLAITATVWQDTNGDNAWSAGEPRVQFSSKLSKTVSYEYEAKGS